MSSFCGIYTGKLQDVDSEYSKNYQHSYGQEAKLIKAETKSHITARVISVLSAVSTLEKVRSGVQEVPFKKKISTQGTSRNGAIQRDQKALRTLSKALRTLCKDKQCQERFCFAQIYSIHCFREEGNRQCTIISDRIRSH